MKVLSPKYLLFVLGFGFQFTLLGLAMRLDPDPHHDGILYGAAVSVKNGGFPNRDAFAQYGPLIPELQGLWLRLFGPSLFYIRFQALLIFILCSIAIWYVAKNYFPPISAFTISSAWVLALPSVLPWPNIYTTLIAILSLLTLVDIPRRQLRDRPVATIIASALIGIGTFGRIHLLAIFVLVLIYLIVSQNQRPKIVFWLLGYFGSVSTILFVIFLNGSLSSFITQCISWPLTKYAGPELSKSYLVGFLWYPIIFFFIASSVVFIAWLLKKYRSSFFSLLIAVSAFMSLLWISRQDRVGNLTLANPRILAIDSATNMLNSISYFAAFLMVLCSIYLLFNSRKIRPEVAISILYCAGILTQLYPLYDVNHLWLISPILLIVCLVTFGDHSLFSKHRKDGTMFVLTGVCVALVAQLLLFISIPREPFESPSLKGMYAPARFTFYLDKTMKDLTSFAAPESTLFECENGLYAGAGGNYLASSPAFVNWGPSNESFDVNDLIFMCDATDQEIEMKTKSGYTVIFKTPLVYFGDSEESGLWRVLLRNTK
jgi:hypothetical protein